MGFKSRTREVIDKADQLAENRSLIWVAVTARTVGIPVVLAVAIVWALRDDYLG